MLSAATLVVLGDAFAGGFVSGLVGFGTGHVALGIWLHVLAPATAPTLVVVCSVVSQAQTIPAIWHAIDRARIWPMLAGGLLGVPVGSPVGRAGAAACGAPGQASTRRCLPCRKRIIAWR